MAEIHERLSIIILISSVASYNNKVYGHCCFWLTSLHLVHAIFNIMLCVLTIEMASVVIEPDRVRGNFSESLGKLCKVFLGAVYLHSLRDYHLNFYHT